MGSLQPSAADEALLRRRAEALDSLRALTTTEFVVRSTVEAVAASLLSSPPFLVFFFADGVFNARYPRVAVGRLPPPIPQTFPGLLSAGLRYSLSCGVRTLVWVAGAHGLGTALRESLHTGWRHEERPKDNAAYYLSGLVTGAGMAVVLTSDWSSAMGNVRRGGYVAFGAMVGALLPDLMLRAGPGVRRKLEGLRGGGEGQRTMQ